MKRKDNPDWGEAIGRTNTQSANLSPSEALVVRVGNMLASAFGEQASDPMSLSGRLITATRQQLPLLQSGTMVEASVTLAAHQGNADELGILTDAFGIDLPEPGLKGLRSLLAGLRELGESRSLEIPEVHAWNERRITHRDIAEVVSGPTLVSHVSSSPETSQIDSLIIPSPTEDHVVFVFGGTGLTVVDNQPDNPVIVDLMILPV